MYLWSLTLWVVFLGLAVPYARRARHPSLRPLEAYLVFVAVFSLCAGALFFGLTWLLIKSGATEILAHPVGGATFVVLVFVPALLIARWQIRRPRVRRPS